MSTFRILDILEERLNVLSVLLDSFVVGVEVHWEKVLNLINGRGGMRPYSRPKADTVCSPNGSGYNTVGYAFIVRCMFEY